jgi:DNA recombination protein RmuC
VEVAIFILLVILVGIIVWQSVRDERRLKSQSDLLARTLEDRLSQTTAVFGDLREKLGELGQKTDVVAEVGRNLTALEAAFKEPKFRGGFGEVMLERLLNDALPRDCFSLQYRFRNNEIVDAVIKIGDRLLPIDAKFPMEDFKCPAQDGLESDGHKQFEQSLKRHINNVARYILPDEGTFEFALMYLPAESVYYELIRRGSGEDSLYSYCLGRRVIPVSPNSFYALLQVIVLGLNGLQVEKRANEILDYLGRLRVDFDSFERDFNTLGSHLHNAQGKYDDAVRKLVRLDSRLKSLPTESEGDRTEVDR